MGLQDKIDEVYVQCSAGIGSATFRSVAKVFWPILDNSVSLIDLAGVYTVSAHESLPGLTISLFSEFFHGLARVKYANDINFCERLLADLNNAKKITFSTDSPILSKAMDREVTRVLLSFDFPLRRAFSNFAGESVKVGGGLTWEEVRRLCVGMEVEGFIAFSGAYNIIPESLNIQQCDAAARTVLAQFPLLGGNTTMQSTLLFPQFQLLLCHVASERYEHHSGTSHTASSSSKPTTSGFAKKVTPTEVKSMADMLCDLLRSLGIDKLTATRDKNPATSLGGTGPSTAAGANGTASAASANNAFSGTVSLPAYDGLDNPANNASSSKYASARQAMLMRLDHLFEKDLENRLQQSSIPSQPELPQMLAPTKQHHGMGDDASATAKQRNLLNKPVVIGDAIPVPSTDSCPESVEQMLQAALAHHNLGNFDESLKFLEASRVQLFNVERTLMIKAKQRELEKQREYEMEDEAADNGMGNNKSSVTVTQEMIDSVTVQDSEVQVPINLEMYITLCQGNVYQSCGDDEQALHAYLTAWTRAAAANNKEWEVVCINSIGLVAYYNVRFEIAITCFSKVVSYRAEIYGTDSPDTATAWNNQSACLYCLNKRGEARVLFERSWNALCKVLGHRHPRCVTVWKNLDKARRSQATLSDHQSMNESVKLRNDSDFIIPGNFTVNAVLPEGEGGGKKKKAKKGGKKKK